MTSRARGKVTLLSNGHDRPGGMMHRMRRRSEARYAVAAYVADRLGRECKTRGKGAEIARATGFTRGHVSAVVNGASGVGEDFAEAIATYWGMTYAELQETADRWAAANGVVPPQTEKAAALRRLRERPEWSVEIAVARSRYPTVPNDYFD